MSTLPTLPEPSPGGPPALPDDTVDLAIEVIAEALAPATRRSYRAAWADWEERCADHERQALLADRGFVSLAAVPASRRLSLDPPVGGVCLGV